MFSASFLQPILLLSLALQASATQFCKCQNEQYGHTFDGIQHICKNLNNDWCSTNCDFFHGSCDYCQYKPAGPAVQDGYEELKKWCFKQQDWDAASRRYFRGSEVNCYSAKNAAPIKWGGTGCDHEDNGDIARDRTAYLRIQLEGGWYERRGCSNLLPSDWSDLVRQFLGRNDDCKAIDDKTTGQVIDCPYTAKEADNTKRKQVFKDACESLKGHWYLRDNGPSFFRALPDKEAVQQPLLGAQRYRPRKYRNDGAEAGSEWTSKQPQGDGIATADDFEETSGQSSTSEGGTRPLIHHEVDVRINFVDEQL